MDKYILQMTLINFWQFIFYNFKDLNPNSAVENKENFFLMC